MPWTDILLKCAWSLNLQLIAAIIIQPCGLRARFERCLIQFFTPLKCSQSQLQPHEVICCTHTMD